ncbi:MAG: metallophosphoesterase [Clostridia bacterium]|nr:metallophosphoesterase [Clostridia bacterium]
MRVLVISDSHGNFGRMYDLFKKEDCRAVIFLGDGIREAERLYDMSGAVPVYRVRGNCDMGAFNTPDEQLIELAGKRIFITHGHNYFVKSGLFRLRARAMELSADIALFGHTHSQFYEKQDGIILANPGALTFGKYAVMTIDGSISIKHGDIYE